MRMPCLVSAKKTGILNNPSCPGCSPYKRCVESGLMFELVFVISPIADMSSIAVASYGQTWLNACLNG